MSVELATLIVTILLALIGYWVSRQQAIELSKRQEQLNLVNKRLNEFYGPLYVATQAGKKANKSFFDKLGRGNIFTNDVNVTSRPSDRELEEWRAWVEGVFMPLNYRVESLIIESAYLILEEEMPECLLQYIVHVSSYKAILKKWENGDFSEYLPYINFPVEINDYASDSYRNLKAEQLKLIGLLEARNRWPTPRRTR